MKNYRIKNVYNYGYKVQKRVLFIFWYTVKYYDFDCGGSNDKLFTTIEEAKKWIKKDIETLKGIKESKYTRYVQLIITVIQNIELKKNDR